MKKNILMLLTLISIGQTIKPLSAPESIFKNALFASSALLACYKQKNCINILIKGFSLINLHRWITDYETAAADEKTKNDGWIYTEDQKKEATTKRSSAEIWRLMAYGILLSYNAYKGPKVLKDLKLIA